TFEQKNIVVAGKWLKIASISDEEWLESDLQDPEKCISYLRTVRSNGLNSDVFTFAQQLPAVEPKFSYYLERDNIAALPIPSFDEWWQSLPQESRKNVRRAEKRGVTACIKTLDDDLVRGIMGVNNDDPMRQGVPYIHYGKSFEQVQRDQSSFLDRSEYVCAYHEDELIGFTKLVYRAGSATIL